MAEGSGRRLLLVCDDPDRAAAVRASLDRVDIVDVQPPSAPPSTDQLDLVLLVPSRTDDCPFLERWAASPRDVDLLVLIDEKATSLSTRAMAAGAVACCPSSATPEELRAAIDRLVARARETAWLKAERDRHRSLIEAAPMGVFEISEGRLSYINDYALQTLGYTREEVIGRRPEELDLVVPEERARLRRAIDDRRRGIRGPEASVYHFRGKSGGIYVVEIRSRSVETADGPIVEGTIRDITLETRLNQLQRVVLELGEIILAESDIDRILQLVLDTITEYSGFRRAVLSLYDLSVPVPFEGEVYSRFTSGLTIEERDALLSQPPMSIAERKQVFSERYRLGPAYYIPHDKTPWTTERGIVGRVALDSWDVNDFLFIPLRGSAGIIGTISVDDPIDRSAPTAASIEPVAALANFAAMAVERVFEMSRLQRQKEQLHGLSRFGVQLAEVNDVRTLCELATQRVHQDMDYGLCSICIADGTRLVQEAIAGADGRPPDGIPRREGPEDVAGPGVAPWAFRHATPVIIPNVAEDARYAGPTDVACSLMAIPIVGRKGPIGVIEVASDRLAAFDEQDLEVISTLASQLSTAISAIRRRDALIRIYSFGQRLATASMLDQVVTGTLDFLVEQFDFELSSILLTSGSDSLSIVGIRGPYSETGLTVGTRLSFDQGVVGWVAKNRRPALISDVRNDPRYHRAFSGTRCELAVPILFGGGLLGVINVESQQPSFFDFEDRQLLEVVANHLSIALSNLTSHETLREQAIRDPLTGLFNRHYFNSIIASELSRADRYRRPLSLMMIDVDGFRAVNNAFGHLKGDEVLREIAGMLERSVRASDRVIRYGGDEFLILMPETDATGDATLVADRLRRRITEIPDLTGTTGVTIGLSIGLYTRKPDEERSLTAILEEVDRRMFADKQDKKNDAD